MDKATAEALDQAMTSITAELTLLRAKSEALGIVLCAVAKKLGLDEERIAKTVADTSALIHQKLLERAENINPGLAAQIDLRKEFPDLPDHLEI